MIFSAAFLVSQPMSISQSKCPMLQTMASSFMFSKWLKGKRKNNHFIQLHKTLNNESIISEVTHCPRMMSSQPVVVTKMFPSLEASSMVVTS